MINTADVYTDFNGLAKLKTQAKQDSPEALKEVAKQFESLFLNNILKGMRAAKLADGAMDNEQSKSYTDMYDQQLAIHLAGGTGLADLIVKQLSPATSKNEKIGIENYLNNPIKTTPPTVHHEANIQILPYFRPASPNFNDIQEELPKQITSIDDFIRQLYPYAVQAAKDLGVEPKVLLAQAALESGWGESVIKDGNGINTFNLFNIKADKSWIGKQAQVSTLEFDQGIPRKVSAGFRSYNSFKESFNDYVDFIKSNPRYNDALKKAGNPGQYMHELQKAGYATDPKYAEKVMSIYQGVSVFKDVTLAMN